MEQIVNRILQVIQDSGLDKKAFADKIGISAGTLSHITSGRNNPSLDLILSILESFPSISAEWLLRGKGNLDKNQINSKVDREEVDSINLKDRIKLLKMLVTEHYRTELNLLDDLQKQGS